MANVRITDARYSGEIRPISVHNHDCYQIIFLKNGSLTAVIAGKTYEVTAPAFLFISFMESHALIPKGEVYDRYYINIANTFSCESAEEWPLLTILSRRPDSFCHILHLDGEEAGSRAEYIMRSLAAEQESGLPYAGENKELLFRQLLIFLYRLEPRLFPGISDRQDQLVGRVQRYLELHHRSSLNNRELAAVFHVSVSYLSHTFKEITGYSLHQYLMNCRLSSARTMLRETDLPVTEIAYAVGFEDGCNFSRLFHRRFGMTPREFRKAGKEELS